MLTTCERCGHRLLARWRRVGSVRVLTHFDEEEGSPTYAHHAPRCPGCGTGLDRGVWVAPPQRRIAEPPVERPTA